MGATIIWYFFIRNPFLNRCKIYFRIIFMRERARIWSTTRANILSLRIRLIKILFNRFHETKNANQRRVLR